MSNLYGLEASPTFGKAAADIKMPPPRHVPLDAPWRWLAAGWLDLWRIPVISLTYGAIFAGVAAAIGVGLWSLGLQSLMPTLVAGFMLIGPLMAVGLYEASQRLAGNRPVSFADVAFAGFRARGQLAFFGALLVFAFLAWVQVACLLFMLFFGGASFPPASELVQTLLFSAHGLGLLVTGTAVGALMAAFVFAISVTAVPQLLVTRSDVITAARASLEAVLENPWTMALWAALIVVIMGAGVATLLLGLVLAFPLIGHATWHAYLDIYGPEPLSD